MPRKLLTVSVLAAALATAAVALAAPSSTSSTPKLVGTVGPGYTITLTQNGTKVSTLKAATYSVVVHDKASIHAFSLDGPHGYAKDYTKIPFIGTKTFTVKLAAGKYKYYCPAHEPTMFGHFAVK